MYAKELVNLCIDVSTNNVLNKYGSCCPKICLCRSFWNRDFLLGLDQSATTKMTVWTMGSFHGLDLKTHLLGEMLHKQTRGGFLTLQDVL